MNALKPEKSAFRLDGSTIFQNSSFRSILRFCLFLACLGVPLGLVLGGLWGVLGLSWPFLSHLGPSQARSGQVMPFRIRTRSVGAFSPPPPGQEGVHPSYKDGSSALEYPPQAQKVALMKVLKRVGKVLKEFWNLGTPWKCFGGIVDRLERSLDTSWMSWKDRGDILNDLGMSWGESC